MKSRNKKIKRGSTGLLYKRTVGDVIFDIINYTFFALFTLCCFSLFIICLLIR